MLTAAVRALFEHLALPSDPISAAEAIKRHLARRGFSDGPFFEPDEILANRAGNCLGYSLMFGALLEEQGHRVDYVLRVNPRDVVHHEGAEHFAMLCAEVDQDSRLPDARDTSARFRFAPLEHASLVVDGRPFEPTGIDLAEDPVWAPDAMTGDRSHLEEALTAFPEYVDAYWALHRPDPTHAAITAWAIASSEFLDLERFYRREHEVLVAAYSTEELEELLSSFGEA